MKPFPRLRYAFAQLAALGALSLSAGPAAGAPPEAMQQLFKILRDRGSISDEEYRLLTTMAEKDQQAAAKPAAAPAPAPSLEGPALENLGRLEERVAAGEQRLARVEQGISAPKESSTASKLKDTALKWFEKYKVDGYTQFRFTTPLNDAAEGVHVPADRSVSRDESLIIRRGRFKFSGDVTEHLYLYSQLDFAGSVFGSGGSFGLQARDLFADFSFDHDKAYRARVGLSKVPFGWVNMQSSQNRGPLERPDALNSAFEGERDQGAYFMYTPPVVRARFKELANAHLKGSGDYGMFTVGAISGQGLNRSDLNGEPHLLARLTYPWKLPNGQFFETAINAYTGKFVVGTREVDRPDGTSIEPFSSDNGTTDQRVGVSAILYPQPFGLEAEWNWGRGPELTHDYSRVGEGYLHGGYVQANYRLETAAGGVFPFLRWQYYDGARKFASNAPRDKVNELDFGMEWTPWPELELSLMYTHTFQRTNTNEAPYRDVKDADRLGVQVQWNY